MKDELKLYNALLIEKQVQTIGCIFPSTTYGSDGPRKYTYIVPDDMQGKVSEGDYAVVETQKGFSVVQVVEVHETCQVELSNTIEFKHIVDIVDLTGYADLQLRIRKAKLGIANDLRNAKATNITKHASPTTKQWI